MPDGYELKDMQDLIDKWHDKYCFSTDSEGNDKVAPEHVIDLDYVNEALREWSENTQWKLSYEGQDKARNDARARMCTIAFHCAIVIHMLFDEQELDDTVKKQGVIDLTTYIADYCMERYLHKFGRELNELHKKNLEAEMIDDSANPTQGDQAQGKKLVTDIAELSRLHSIKDKRGQNKYGWDTLVEMSGMARSTLMNKVKKYEKNHTK